MLPVLLEGVAWSTQHALQVGWYNIGARAGHVSIDQRAPTSELFGSSLAWLPQREDTSGEPPAAPPFLSFCAADALDAGVDIAYDQNNGASAVVVAAEVSQFTARSGRLDFKPGVQSTESCLFLRSNLREELDRASDRLSSCSLRDHLMAEADPYVLQIGGVTVFRGPVEEGFPFLQRPAKLDLVLFGRSFRAPVRTVTRGGRELFAEEIHLSALVDRLKCVALAALRQQNVRFAPTRLVIGLHTSVYPLHSLAEVLKEWHHLYASYFSEVIVACGARTGGESLACQLDHLVNGDLSSAREPAALASLCESCRDSEASASGLRLPFAPEAPQFRSRARTDGALMSHRLSPLPSRPCSSAGVHAHSETRSSGACSYPSSCGLSALSSSKRYMMIHLQALRQHEVNSQRSEMIKVAELGADVVYASARDGERGENRVSDGHAVRMVARERFRTKRGLTPRALDPLDNLPLSALKTSLPLPRATG